jgi:hypothetical protein
LKDPHEDFFDDILVDLFEDPQETSIEKPSDIPYFLCGYKPPPTEEAFKQLPIAHITLI